MTTIATLPALLSTLTESLNSANNAVPDTAAVARPTDGISLLDTKNELLLSYLQNLVFLIIIKLRSGIFSNTDVQSAGNGKEQDEVVKKLVELRVYLERGVRPLENRLKYQIDKVLRTADDASRSAAQKTNAVPKTTKPQNASRGHDGSASGSDDDSDIEDTEEAAPNVADIDDLAYRPNPAALARPSRGVDPQSAASGGIYRPPRITPTALPTIQGHEERAARKPNKSATLDEFISTELSTAPLAEPSIGSTIVSGGRRSKSQKEREKDTERRVYEESNFVRLPKESRKGRAKSAGGRPRDGGYGGEEWRGLGEGLERIERLTKGKKGVGVLERSRKRAVEDGPRGRGGGGGGGEV
ncbi:MAG: U3 small nucleolar ribonucleo LCP5 [Lasallia pustulata]|uniref:U3 small nucleolar ribonucleo LCP5 n=1 Tax=Lasallia pustulata TaxID=136370 RepID=A0A5M8PMJ9_9LECA|nr:MAG: U3 small nucleolar ribonucleo LCP5 [Lasallia pustulata]